jgi:hypothetical protein
VQICTIGEKHLEGQNHPGMARPRKSFQENDPALRAGTYQKRVSFVKF